ncbi:MAG: major capsid protein, partial [Legionellales bacterium]|nr:major capsid protein [Legionellales bacterium]
PIEDVIKVFDTYGYTKAQGLIRGADEAVDYVSDDDVIYKEEGDIPKLGMKLALDERTMTDLDLMERSSASNAAKEIIKKLFGDTKKVIYGVYEQSEFLFLQALSTGLMIVKEENNVGTGIRVDFGHPAKNKFGASVKWSDTSAKPIDDIERIIDKASESGDVIQHVLMDKTSFNSFKNNAQVKELYAAHIGITGSNIPTPSLKKVNEALLEDKEVQIQIINRSVNFEKNGVRTTVKAWEPNKVVFLTSLEVGTLSYGTLAEENHKAKHVEYQKADDYILVSKYHKNDPLREFTTSQALVVPVIDNVDSIYILDAEEAATDTQTEGDVNFDYEGTSYTKQSVVDAINLADATLKALISNQDSTLLNKINKLSEEGIETFEANITTSV